MGNGQREQGRGDCDGRACFVMALVKGFGSSWNSDCRQASSDESDSASVPFAEVIDDIHRRLWDEYDPHDLEFFPMDNRKAIVVMTSDKFEGMCLQDRHDNVRQFLTNDLRTGRLSSVTCSLKTRSEQGS